MGDRLDEPDLVVLARVIDRGSFTKAAADLAVPPSTLSRRVAALEERLGVRALERTTRHLRPTEVGEMLAALGRQVRSSLEEAERLVADHRSSPRGLLRLAFPTPASNFIGPVLADMLTRYPDLRVELVATDDALSLLAEGFDAALHVGSVRGASSYGVVRLGRIGPVLAASSAYLARSPAIRHPRDLEDPGHTVVGYRGAHRPKWQFVHGKSNTQLAVTPPSPRALVTNKTLVVSLVSAGIGLALVPRAAVAANPDMEILEPAGYRPVAGVFSIVTPSARTSAPKVRAFVDAMRAFIASRPELFS